MKKIFDTLENFTKHKSIDPMILIGEFYKFIRLVDEIAEENTINTEHVKIICYFLEKHSILIDIKLENFDDITKYCIIYFVYIHVVNDDYDIHTHKIFGNGTVESREFTKKFLKLNDDHFPELFKMNNDRTIIRDFWESVK